MGTERRGTMAEDAIEKQLDSLSLDGKEPASENGEQVIDESQLTPEQLAQLQEKRRQDLFQSALMGIELPKTTLEDEAVLAMKLGGGCKHSPAEPCPPCHQAYYEWLQALYATFKQKLGLEHELTLNSLIDCAYELIKAYKLTACDELLTEGFDVCKQRGSNDSYYIKMIQAMAFLRFKQFRFNDAVILFEEMKTILGPNPSLLENMGHAYNSTGDQENAERCFTEALDIIDTQKITKVHKGGLLLGLGLVKARQGRPEEGLVQLREALQWYIDEHNGADNALTAKACVSVAGTLEQLERFSEAEPHYREAIRIFKATCGDINPLTADALRKLGMNLAAQQSWEDASSILEESLVCSVSVDSFSINLTNLTELVSSLLEVYSKLEGKDSSWFIPLIRQALSKLLARDETIIDSPNFGILFQLCIKDIPPETIKEITEAAQRQEQERQANK